MPHTRLVSAIMAAGVITAGISTGTAWAGGPGGAVENVDQMSAAVGTGVLIDELAGFLALGNTNEEAMANVVAQCEAAGGMACSSDMATNVDNCIGAFADPVNFVAGGGAGATIEEARQNAIQRAIDANIPVYPPDVFLVIADCWEP